MLLKMDKNKWRIFALIAVVSVAIPMLMVAFVLITTDKESVVFFEHTNPILAVFIILYYVLIVGGGLVWLVLQIAGMVKLKNETVKNELQHLQSQVSPHFFFNVLNNLYGLVGKDTEKAQQLILKLSDMMRYSIYEGQKEAVAIGEEVAYLENYITLHQMRYHKTIDLKFETDIADEQLQIMPLLFIILVENAFKHGVEHLRANAFVHIRLKTMAEELVFEVVNNFDPEETSQQKGVGLKNLKRRLTLVYPKKHDLSVTQIAGVYKAVLTLQL